MAFGCRVDAAAVPPEELFGRQTALTPCRRNAVGRTRRLWSYPRVVLLVHQPVADALLKLPHVRRNPATEKSRFWE